LAQGFAGLGETADGYAAVVPGRAFSFPADHDHIRNSASSGGTSPPISRMPRAPPTARSGTLFRQATKPGAQNEGWANQQLWMGHAAVTRADTHRTSETFARGGVGQAGADANPFLAWIDAWEMRGLDSINATNMAPLELKAAGC
jgi:predicted secreted hydrolase